MGSPQSDTEPSTASIYIYNYIYIYTFISPHISSSQHNNKKWPPPTTPSPASSSPQTAPGRSRPPCSRPGPASESRIARREQEMEGSRTRATLEEEGSGMGSYASIKQRSSERWRRVSSDTF